MKVFERDLQVTPAGFSVEAPPVLMHGVTYRTAQFENLPLRMINLRKLAKN
jgi:hypothetical protein